MDYEALLRKYMEHVLGCEGTTFVSHLYQTDFSPEEIARLQKMDQEEINRHAGT
jgi:hypothetical protein